MTPETPSNPRAELEARVTALLLGELTPEAAAEVHALLAGDPELAKFEQRLRATLGFVRDMAAEAPLKLNGERREKLLAQFKTVKVQPEKSRRRIYWLSASVGLAAAVMVMFYIFGSAAKEQARGAYSMTSGRQVSESSITSTFHAIEKHLGLSKKTVDIFPIIGSLPSNVTAHRAITNTAVSPPLLSAPTVTITSGRVQTSGATEYANNNSANLHQGYGNIDADRFKTTQTNSIVLPESEKAGDTTATFYADGNISQKLVTTDQPTGDFAFSTVRRGAGNVDANRLAPETPIGFGGAGGGGAQVSNGNHLFYDAAKDRLASVDKLDQSEAGSLPSGRFPGPVAKSAVNATKLPESFAAEVEPPPVMAAPAVPLDTSLDETLEKTKSASPSISAHGGSRLIARTREESRTANRGRLIVVTPIPGLEGPSGIATVNNGQIGAQGGTAPASPLPEDSVNMLTSGLRRTSPPQVARPTGSSGLLADNAPASASVPAPALPAVSGKINQTFAPLSSGEIKKTAETPVNDLPLARPLSAPPIPQAEMLTRENAFTTFSLNVSDVAFKLAQASLQNGAMPEPSTLRSEEFINAFDYRDPEPAPGAPIGFAWERATDPFSHNRDFIRFSIKTAAQGRQAGRPINLVLLLDKSGSMERADRVAIIARALHVLAGELQASDTLSVVIFARTARLFADGVPGSEADRLAKELRDLTPEGGTNLEEAMKLAYAAAHRHYLADGENRIVLLTDGAANLGDVDPNALKKMVQSYRQQGMAFDCFGVGWDGYNDQLLEALSRAGGGRYGFLNTPEEAGSEFAGKLAGALRVAAADVKVQVEFNPRRVTAYRQIGYAKDQLKKEEFRDNSVKAAQIGAAESGNALYTVEVNPNGEGALGTVHVRFRVPGTTRYEEHEWPLPYTGEAKPLDQSSPALRLGVTAAEFCEWLAANPYAGDVTPDRLLQLMQGIPQVYGADTRPVDLETMIHEAKTISGK